jgi:hypothetical protein
METKTTKMTITRALNTLKLLDKRIEKSINNSVFANFTIGGKSDLEKYTPKEDLQSVEDLISYRAKIKSSIMTSNSKTTVTIGNIKMSVVEAIESKDSIKYKKLLLKKIKTDLVNVARKVEYNNDDVKSRLDQLVQVSFGKDIKTNSGDYDSIALPFLKKNEAKDVDSSQYSDYAIALEDEISTFESEVDLVLSESNAVTTITV